MASTMRSAIMFWWYAKQAVKIVAALSATGAVATLLVLMYLGYV